MWTILMPAAARGPRHHREERAEVKAGTGHSNPPAGEPSSRILVIVSLDGVHIRMPWSGDGAVRSRHRRGAEVVIRMCLSLEISARAAVVNIRRVPALSRALVSAPSILRVVLASGGCVAWTP